VFLFCPAGGTFGRFKKPELQSDSSGFNANLAKYGAWRLLRYWQGCGIFLVDCIFVGLHVVGYDCGMPNKPSNKSSNKKAVRHEPNSREKKPVVSKKPRNLKGKPNAAKGTAEAAKAKSPAIVNLPVGETRVEQDSMGQMTVPADVLYGASTQRAVLNFPVSGRPVLKAACARVNLKLTRMSTQRAGAISEACREIEDGLIAFGGLNKHFPIDIFQTGSGTSTNMNVNEVVANIVCLRRHAPIGSSKNKEYVAAGGVHPNDHVNMGQSSNDTFPTAMHIAAAKMMHEELLPALDRVASELEAKAKQWDKLVKIGRTHLQDATPIRLGQEFSGYASQLRHAQERVHRALHTLSELAIGGTAVGTGINCHEDFGKLVAADLTRTTGVHFREAANHFEAQHAKDAYVEASGILKTIAVSLSKIANDIRWLGSGPRCGIGELVLPAVQPGSSIMPGKTNPVICESVIMVCCQVIGNDTAITYGGFGGVGSNLDLNVAMPMMAANMLDSIHLLSRACLMFDQNLLRANGEFPGLLADEKRCNALIEGSLAMCTSLVPVIGYDASAALAKNAFKQGKTVRQLAYETVVGTKDGNGKVITREDIDTYLNPWGMTLPGGEGSAGG
jgi:fumarate hydratase, class II